MVASFLDEEVTLKRMAKLKNHLKKGGENPTISLGIIGGVPIRNRSSTHKLIKQKIMKKSVQIIATSHFSSPQMLVFRSGNPRLFQGNLGEILFHLA